MVRLLIMVLAMQLSMTDGASAVQAHDDTAFQQLLTIDGRPPRQVVVTSVDVRSLAGEVPRDASASDGVLAVLPFRSITRWRRTLAAHPETVTPHTDLPHLFLHLVRDEHRRRISLIELDESSYLLTDWELFARVSRELVEESLSDTPLFRGSRIARSVSIQRGAPIALPHPYVTSPIRITRQSMNRRIYRGMNIEVRDAAYNLARETMHVRLPREYDPASPAGLLVWASPTRSGEIPRVLHEALDELNVVAIGVDNSGNAREVPEKFQLMFDAAATAQRRFNIDPSRVYIAGMSGGGKVATVLTFCFPERFRGAIAIVGAGTPHELDDSWAEHRFPYCRPTAEAHTTVRRYPIVMITGPNDFNYAEMKARHEMLVRNAYEQARFMDIPSMGHTMPTSKQFTDALRWVEEKRRTPVR